MKRLLTIIFALASLMGWAQTVQAPEFNFEGDNLVMTTGTANASIFYGIAELSDLTDEVVTATTNSLVQLNTYYTQPIEIKSNVVVKAIAVSDEGGTTVQSDTTILAYGYTLWVELQTAMDRGNTVYAKANGNTAVDTQLLSDLQWAIEEGEMMMNARGSAPYFEAEHFAQTINDLCDQIEAIIGTAEPYAVLSADGLTVTFYYDDQKTARGGIDINSSNYVSATKAVIDDTFASYLPTNTSYWFEGCSNLTNIEGIANLKTDNVTDMRSMFDDCSGLTSLDLSNFNTTNVTDMAFMFYNCSSLTNLDLSGFNTSNVTSMYGMFRDCSGLTSLDVSSFNTANVESMRLMFLGCSSLTSLDVSGFNTTNVTNMDLMFWGCSGLTSLDLSGFNTINVTSMEGLFRDCSGLTSLDVSSFNTTNVTNMQYMFFGCSSLTSLDLSNFNTANVTDFTDFVSNCSSLAAIQAGNATIPDSVYDQIGNPNLLVYVNDASLVPGGIQNVVINGTAPEIILTDADSGNNNWYCPQPFTAQKISYTRNFQQQTQIGVARGWESIALPFDVQTITYEDNRTITPFANNDGSYHFWLRRLTQNGLQSVQEIEANVAYVISMPNSSEYPGEYILAGNVTFSAENAPIPETEPEVDESADRAMTPAFQRMEVDEHIYALNVGEPRGNYPEGSVFEKNYREVRPFEAFTKHFGENGSRFMSIADMLDGGVTGIEELKSGRMEGWKSENWYDLNGRRVLRPSKGVYIHNGKQVIVK